jgi:hypothetical protein
MSKISAEFVERIIDFPKDIGVSAHMVADGTQLV